MRAKSFSARMAALRFLEAQAEAKRAAVPDLPDLATMSDDEVVWEATLGVRSHNLQVELSAPLGPVRLARCTWGTSDAWHRFYTELAPRATTLLAAIPRPIVFLAAWEVDHAIAVIDAGECTITHHEHMRAGALVPTGYRLFAIWQGQPLPDDVDELQRRHDISTTLHAVNTALDLVNRQCAYPQPRDFDEPEMTTLAEWRAWLEGLICDSSTSA